jgi:peptide chain release factor 3
MDLLSEIKIRRTFAIISHPDAGKTTLTEKFLLMGGAIQVAGAVKSNKIRKSATSDFLEIEKQRGISVATSVMAFDYKGLRINILDTPGHKDFAEDTYRTLTAVDSVILVIDSVKGVEEQTRKLMEVCRMRNTPVMIFINKLDMQGKDPFDLLDEVEKELKINLIPLTWPIGQGSSFQGVYNLHTKDLRLFDGDQSRLASDVIQVGDIFESEIEKHLQPRFVKAVRDDVNLINEVYESIDLKGYREGKLAPVFYGSAINNFGVRELLDTFSEMAPCPGIRESVERPVDPTEDTLSGFVFKIHANLDPNHRDRIAFLRICSGKFERNKFYFHVRNSKKLRFPSPASFMGNSKSLIDEAFPGDVIGLYDSGNFKIGDTLTEGESLQFKGIPSFSPEIFREVVNRDPFKTKQLDKGVRQLTEEGVAQLFIQQPGNKKIIGTVGELQFDVIKFRLEHEYGAKCSFSPLNFYKAAWISSPKKDILEGFIQRKAGQIAWDKEENPVYFSDSEWMLRMSVENFPDIHFQFTSEYNYGSGKY